VRLAWVQPEDLLPHELVQSVAEGRDTSAVAARWVAAGGSLDVPAGGASSGGVSRRLRELARDLLDELDALPRAAAIDAAEPDDLAGIVATWPDVPALPAPPDRFTLRERLRGAWLGRASGCLLGKPVEGLPRRGIRAILEATGRRPLAGYFTADGLSPDVAARWPWHPSYTAALAENIDGMPEDDDLDFTMLALRVLERCGREFTTEDVAHAWLDDLPAARTYTAERVTYRNLLEGHQPDEAARVRNPFREWIGAQIRADLFGWVCPGRPRDAARLAWRDARLSHTRNGVYGAMFVAAVNAAALVVDDVRTVLVQGLGVVPPTSRLARAIRVGVDLADEGADREDALDALDAAYGHLHWVHVLNNAALVAYALAASDGDFTAGITTAVTGGWDTDSDGATVGAVLGAMAGERRVPSAWTAPLRDYVNSCVPGFDGASLIALADRTHALLDLD
jgi:ADP-ribosylglycohydrolase